MLNWEDPLAKFKPGNAPAFNTMLPVGEVAPLALRVPEMMDDAAEADTAPISARPPEIFRPPRKYGSALGTSRPARRCHGDAP